MERSYRIALIITLALVIASTVALFQQFNLNSPFKTSSVLLPIANVLAVATFAFATLLALFRITSATDRISGEVDIVRKSLAELTKAVDDKKEKFLNIPNISFHFADKNQIVSFYNDYFKEPAIEQIVSEITGGVVGEVKAKIPQVLESKVGSKDLSKWISTIKLPDISIAEKFRRYQRETIRNGQVTLGLEIVDIDLSDLDAFEDIIAKLKSNFDMELDDAQIEKQRSILKKKAAERTILRLENATGWALMEGKFTISELPTDFYKCTYVHPVSNYLDREGKEITISVIFKKDCIEQSIAGNYAQSIGRSIPLKIYGKVWQPVDRKGDVWELQISPLAIY